MEPAEYQKLDEQLDVVASWLVGPDSQTVEAIEHYRGAAELEIAFEIMLLQIMESSLVPNPEQAQQLLTLAGRLGLHEHAVFDPDICQKFQAWLATQASSP